MVKSLEFISFSSLITHCKNIQITQKQNRGRSKSSTLRRHSPNPVRTLRCFFWFGVVWVLRWYHLSQSLKLTSSRELPLISSPPASSSLPSTGVTGVSPFQVFPVLGIKTEPCVWLASTNWIHPQTKSLKVLFWSFFAEFLQLILFSLISEGVHPNTPNNWVDAFLYLTVKFSVFREIRNFLSPWQLAIVSTDKYLLIRRLV